MSGMVGMYERAGAPLDRALLRALTDSLAYCGPDARETWSNGSVGFGHTLLKTSRESRNETQPASLDGRLWITADARIDCRDELLAEMNAGNFVRSATSSDAELILHSYSAWGEDCVQHLRGDFAFAIWDAREKKLFCARDHFGLRPFYYAEPGDLFLFSNVLECIRRHPEVSADLNDAAIGDFLLFGLNCDEATTTFRDIRRLPAAHTLTVSAEGLRLRRYWSAPTEGRIRYESSADYVEHFQILLQAAVTDRLGADRTGILLSGGMDSGTLATTARDLSQVADGAKDLRAYTVVYKSLKEDDEGNYARQVAEFLKIPLRLIPMDDIQPFDRWDDPEIRWPEPVDDPYFAGLFQQFGTVAQDCRVVFSGEGSDNLMHFQMWPYMKDMARRREWLELAQNVPWYMAVRPSPLPGIRRRVNNFFRSDAATRAFPKWFNPDFARRLNLEERAREWRALPDVRQHPLLPKGHASLSLPHWGNLFEKQHAGLTRCPVEVSHPFLDLRVVNFLLALPPFPYFFEKSLLREATVGRLPESVRTRRKTPFTGQPLTKFIERTGGKSLNEVNWIADMDSYIDRESMQMFQSDTDAEQLDADVRPLCLNFWLQSARKVRYNFRAEVRNA
ncbi:MAG TPA: asparagine synthase-related protein [Candidatus Acidoferrales bacterium]